MTRKSVFKVLILITLLAEVFLGFASPVLAQTTQTVQTGGAESSIKELLCAPTDASGNTNAASDDLYNCINKLYKFAIAFSSVGAVFMIVVAGYLYMASDGNEENVRKAKDILISSITALVILLVTFILLREINPELVKFKIIQPPSITAIPGSSGTVGGGVLARGSGRSVGTGRCEPLTSGPASVANLQNTCFASKAEQASSVANGESGGNPGTKSGSDVCLDGNSGSWGLFQINLTVHTIAGLNCPSAFEGKIAKSTKVGKNLYNCRVTNPDLYQRCVNAAKDAATNITKACEIQRTGSWTQWGFYQTACTSKFPAR